ncbi:MAG: metal ABC transporter permease, partial [Bradyrhizobium sp.]
MSARVLVLSITASALAFSAAHAATTQRLRGVIASATADSVTVDPYAGKPVTVALTGKTAYLKVEKSSLDKVEKGGFIGTATKDVGGTQVALEVVVFPPAMRGTCEGHYASDKIP